MPPKSRYVKLNIVDWLLIALLSLLLLATLVRGVGAVLSKEEDVCTADIEFVVRDLDEGTASLLAEQTAPIYLQDGCLLATAYTVSVQPMTELVRDESGVLTEVESLTSYKAIFSFTATGTQARDGTFLLAATRRLATGEALLLTQASVSYTANVLRVSPRAA